MIRAGIATPVGPVWVAADGLAIHAAGWGPGPAPEGDLLTAACDWLAAYFRGSAAAWPLPLAPVQGPAALVRAAMLAIPFGETRTYGQIARDTGLAARAVGALCGANPLPIIVPCHRVMGADGRLTGYSGVGGVDTKVALLRHEGAGGFLL
jgi:methylated-DNA-[protein]-cysteine S-methyltransferase